MKLDHKAFNNSFLFPNYSCLKPESFCFWTFTGMKMSRLEEAPSHVNTLGYIPTYTSMHNQVKGLAALSLKESLAVCVTISVLPL